MTAQLKYIVKLLTVPLKNEITAPTMKLLKVLRNTGENGESSIKPSHLIEKPSGNMISKSQSIVKHQMMEYYTMIKWSTMQSLSVAEEGIQIMGHSWQTVEHHAFFFLEYSQI